MDSQRAKEILSSPILADITYNGTKIYLEDVNETDQTGTIHSVHHPNESLTVPLMNLKEHGSHGVL